MSERVGGGGEYEWYGPLRTYDECMWLEDPHYVPERDGYSYMHEGHLPGFADSHGGMVAREIRRDFQHRNFDGA